ncbi:precorrin-6A synthase (deacetylating) [Patulibacter defluvii]|uniref:precorrin-6A synthase (deacetylating) n=1 Tax=Patulibacter defluvii TaxID=3095358 RepID=UPI002A75B5BB|nr:precorrin-6A synthase (deacetylating) [Patulibacter sp. DM4]
MRHVSIIGIGAGDPDQVTVQAIKAINAVDVFFVISKGAGTDELVALRREILDRYVEGDGYRTVELVDPPRGRSADAHRAVVDDWRQRRADQWQQAIRDELGEDERGAFLVWGDPAIYDSTLGVIDDVLARGEVAFEHEVIPGISSVQDLAARHRIALNQVGGTIRITPGRRLAEQFADGEDVVVMLDAHQAFAEIDDDQAEIYWGASIGAPDQVLIAGRLADVKDEIVRVRAAERERKGWLFDSYLLRRPRR